MASTARVGAHPLLKVAAGGALLWVGVRAFRGSHSPENEFHGRGGFGGPHHGGRGGFPHGGPQSMPPPPFHGAGMAPPPFQGPGGFPPSAQHHHHLRGECPPPPPLHPGCHCHCQCHCPCHVQGGFMGPHHGAFPPPPPPHHHHRHHHHISPRRGSCEPKKDAATDGDVHVDVQIQSGDAPVDKA